MELIEGYVTMSGQVTKLSAMNLTKLKKENVLFLDNDTCKWVQSARLCFLTTNIRWPELSIPFPESFHKVF